MREDRISRTTELWLPLSQFKGMFKNCTILRHSKIPAVFTTLITWGKQKLNHDSTST